MDTQFNRSMLCDRCQQEQWRLFHVWQTSRLVILCGRCLIGETVPAYRSSMQRWNLGQVQAWGSSGTASYKNPNIHSTVEARLFFGGTETEWVHLESAPFDAYTAHARVRHETFTQGYYSIDEEPQVKRTEAIAGSECSVNLNLWKNTAIPDDLKPTLWCGAFDRKLESDYNVGPFRRPTGSLLCTRCSLLTPSRQTGDVVCDSTGWCKSCVETPIYVSDDALRIQHGIPACADINRVSISSSEREGGLYFCTIIILIARVMKTHAS